MANEKAWYGDGDLVPLDMSTVAQTAKSVLLMLVRCLIGTVGAHTQGLWVVESGSNGVAFGNNDAVLRWNALADLVRADGAVAHSWIVLTNGVYRICIDWNTANDYQVDLFFSKALFLGGTLTARPVAADEWGYSDFKFVPTVAAPRRAHFIVDAAGYFWFLLSTNGSGSFTTCIALQILAETHPGDLYPAVSICTYGDAGATALDRQNGGPLGATGGGATHPFTTNANQTVRGRSANGGTLLYGGPLLPELFYNSTNTLMGDMSTDPEDGLHNDFACYIRMNSNTQATIVGSGHRFKGRLIDARWCCSYSAGLCPEGDTEPTGAVPPERMVVSSMWIPTTFVPTL